jgi:hypothetical protein
MRNVLDQWSELYPKRLSGSPQDQAAVNKRIHDLAVEMCRDLESILSHLGSAGMILQDHYGTARSICAELSAPRLS